MPTPCSPETNLGSSEQSRIFNGCYNAPFLCGLCVLDTGRRAFPSLVLIVGLRTGPDIVAIEKCLGPVLTQPTFLVAACLIANFARDAPHRLSRWEKEDVFFHSRNGRGCPERAGEGLFGDGGIKPLIRSFGPPSPMGEGRRFFPLPERERMP